MVYEYHCAKCSRSFDVIKRVSEYDSPESCSCGYEATRVPFPRKIHLSNTSVQDAYFNHALGQVVHGDSHARQIAKERGLIEVGNESINKAADIAHVEREKKLEADLEQVWKGV